MQDIQPKAHNIDQPKNGQDAGSDNTALGHIDRVALLRDGSTLSSSPDSGRATKTDGTGEPKAGSDAKFLTMTDPFAKKDDRATQVDQLKAAFPSGIADVANFDKVMKDGVDTAHSLINAKPEDQQKIFSDAAQKFVKENPQALSEYFTGVLNTALHLSPEHNQLSASFRGTFGALQDRDAKTDKNPSGIVATEFLGTGIKDSDKREKVAFDTEKQVAKDITDTKQDMPSDKQGSFDKNLDTFLGDIRDNGGMTPFKEIGARPRPTNVPSLADQAAELKASFPHSGATDSDKLIAQSVDFANKLAFAKPEDMQATFTQAMDTLSKDHPEVDRAMFPAFLTNAARIATGSRDFSSSAAGDETFFNDRRFKTEGNTAGTVAGALTEGDKSAAFNAALNVAATIRKASATLPASTIERDRDDFNGSVLNLFSTLRTD